MLLRFTPPCVYLLSLVFAWCTACSEPAEEATDPVVPDSGQSEPGGSNTLRDLTLLGEVFADSINTLNLALIELRADYDEQDVELLQREQELENTRLELMETKEAMRRLQRQLALSGNYQQVDSIQMVANTYIDRYQEVLRQVNIEKYRREQLTIRYTDSLDRLSMERDSLFVLLTDARRRIDDLTQQVGNMQDANQQLRSEKARSDQRLLQLEQRLEKSAVIAVSSLTVTPTARRKNNRISMRNGAYKSKHVGGLDVQFTLKRTLNNGADEPVPIYLRYLAVNEVHNSTLVIIKDAPIDVSERFSLTRSPQSFEVSFPLNAPEKGTHVVELYSGQSASPIMTRVFEVW